LGGTRKTRTLLEKTVGSVVASRSQVSLVALLLFGLSFLVASSPALAERTYESRISGFSNPWGIAVDSADNVWISDTGTGVVSKYDPFPSENKIGEQDGEGHWGGFYIRSLAIDSTNGYFYMADSGPVVVDIFDNTGTFFKQFAHNFGGGYDYLAIDNSGGPSKGRLYVVSTNGLLQAFDFEGNPVAFTGSASYINGSEINGTPAGAFSRPWNVATDSSGNIYVLDQSKKLIDEFAPSGLFIQSFDGTGAPGGFSSNLTGVAVDPTNEDLLVADSGNHVVDEFESGGAFVQQLVGTGPGQETPFGTLNGGLAVNSSGYVYVAEGSTGVDIFSPNAILPKVTYGTVTNQTQTSGTLNASVDLNEGPEVTSCFFQYGSTTAYGSTAPCSPSTPYTEATAVSSTISGLTTETPYHYRIVLTTANGTKKGTDQVYLPHAVAGLTTTPASNVARNTTTLNGIYNGDGEDTHYYFEWGTSESYGHATPIEDAGTASGTQNESFGLTGLTVETVYHYRFVGENAAGTSYGTDQSFETQAAVVGLATEPASQITATKATLNGAYTGIGEDVHYYFEWGTDTEYGHTTAIPPGTDDGTQTGAQGLIFTLTGLGIDTIYHYRVVASDAAGTTVGADKSFRTLGQYQYLSTLGAAGPGDGQFNHPKDLAVNASNGDIYVADTGNHRVVKLNSSGNFLAAWGWGVTDGSAAREVCTSGCQAGIPGSGSGQFSTPEFIEVDNSAGPSHGDVYVADEGDGVVQKFDPSGTPVAGWAAGGTMDFSHDGSIGGITVDTAGNLYVLTDNTPYYWTEVSQDGTSQARFPTTQNEAVNEIGTPGGNGIDINSLGVFYETLPSGSSGGVGYSSPNSTIYTSGTLYTQEFGGPSLVNSGLVIDRTKGDVYVDQGSYIDQFEANGSCDRRQGCVPSDTFGMGILTSAAGLAIQESTGRLYAANTGGSDIAVFTPLPRPEVETGAASEVEETSGTMTGHVDPGAPGQVSDCHFEYGTDTTYSLGSVPCSPAAPITSGTDVTAHVTGLQPFMSYHYRLVATRADGLDLPSFGRDRTFTPSPGLVPSVGSTEASNVTPTSATLSGMVNPKNAPTICRFQYGKGDVTEFQTLPSEPIGEDSTEHLVSNEIVGLTPATTYQFRIVATNFNGPSTGEIGTFTTPDRPQVVSTSATNVSDTSATLNAGVVPNFRDTTAHFEYGLSASYGSSTAESSSIGSGGIMAPISATVTGLSPMTTYHFRVVSTNAVGTTAGPDQTFTTGATPSSATEGPTKPVPCKKGFVKKHGKCVKRRPKHHHHHTRKHKAKTHRGRTGGAGR
jgi:phosphodiesterase/alkaline phosphatase D-like protein